MPLTIVVADDDLDYRLIVRALLRPMSATMIVVGEAADGETTHKGVQHSKIFGSSYAWLMDARHADLAAEDLIYCFALVGEKPERCRFFLVPSSDVAAYVKWEHPFWKEQSTRRSGQVTRVRMFRIPAGEPDVRQLPPTWSDGRWQRFEDQWGVFDPQPHRNSGTRNPPKDTAKHRNP